jgi:hypothetical protein
MSRPNQHDKSMVSPLFPLTASLVGNCFYTHAFFNNELADAR